MQGILVWLLIVTALIGGIAYVSRRAGLIPKDWLDLLPRRLSRGILPAEGPPLPAIVLDGEIEEPEPEPAPEPDIGNIRPVESERSDLALFEPDVHEFPEHKPPTTRYEDFNRRLFIHFVNDKGRNMALPATADDDFPTALRETSDHNIDGIIRRFLRPRYHVIHDEYGWWAAASRLLENDPDYTDAVVETYLAIPEATRPVVISRYPGNPKGALAMYRYGFATYRLHIAVYTGIKECLAYLLDKFMAPRNDWQWFSIARMRQVVVRAERERQAEIRDKAERERKTMLEDLTAAREGTGNRWRDLFASRVGLPATTKAAEISASTKDC